MEGWIKLHRILREKPLWTASNCFQRTLLITLLLMANHKGVEWEWRGERYRVGPGQFITSISSLKKELGNEASDKKIRNGLARLKKYGFLTWESTHRNRMITIVNWGLYQSVSDWKGKAGDSISRIAGDLEATNKNEEKEENGKSKKRNPISAKTLKTSYAEFVQMTEKEYASLIGRFSEAATEEMIRILDHYKGADPLKRRYDSDYHAILSWVAKKYQEEQLKAEHQKRKSPLMMLALGRNEDDDITRGGTFIDISEKNPSWD